MTTTAFDRITAQLDVRLRQGPQKVMAICPVKDHDDSTASLSISPRTQRNPGITMNCFHCGRDLPREALGLSVSDLFDKPLERQEWVIRDRQGRVESITTREANGDKRTRVWQERHDLGVKGRTMFNLTSVEFAVAENRPVFITEGPSDMAAMIDAGVVATTNIAGARSWRNTDWSILRLGWGPIVVVIDRDEAGETRGEEFSAFLRDDLREGRAILTDDSKSEKRHAQYLRDLRAYDPQRVVVLAPRHPHNDVRDHLGAGYSIAELVPHEHRELTAKVIAYLTEGGSPEKAKARVESQFGPTTATVIVRFAEEIARQSQQRLEPVQTPDQTPKTAENGAGDEPEPKGEEQ